MPESPAVKAAAQQLADAICAGTAAAREHAEAIQAAQEAVVAAQQADMPPPAPEPVVGVRVTLAATPFERGHWDFPSGRTYVLGAGGSRLTVVDAFGRDIASFGVSAWNHVELMF